MKHRYLLGIDVGTSSTKTVLWRDDFVLVAEATLGYPLAHPEPAWAEIDARTWWDAVCITTRQVLAQSQVNPRAIAGIGVDGLGWGLVPVDASGEPLFVAMIWLDRRAEAEAAWLRTLPEAERLVGLTGNPLDAAYITPKLVWLKHRRPEVFAQVSKLLTCTGFIVQRLCGEFTCDVTQGYGFHLFDMQRNCWDSSAAALLGIPVEALPQLVQPTEIVGKVTLGAAEATGLAPGTPVLAGCVDAAVGAFGAGVTRSGQAADQGGTAFGMILCLDRFIVEPRLILSRHVLSGQYLLQGGTVGGGALRWVWDTFGRWGADTAVPAAAPPFDQISQEAADAPPGAHGLIFLPYMAGERSPIWNGDARGVFVGLSYATTRGDMLRAMMEGCAFAVYHNILVAQTHAVDVQEWFGAGGAVRSPTWCQIKADISNRPFVVASQADGRPGDNTLGLAILAAKATGLQDEPAATAAKVLCRRQVYEPGAARHRLYQDLFSVYLDVADKLMNDCARLNAIAASSPPCGKETAADRKC